MPRPKKDGSAYADKGRRTAQPASLVSEAVRGAGVEVLLSAPSASDSASDAIKALALYDEGWIRIVSHEMGRVVYYKFKFMKGKFGGNYVFFRDMQCDPSASLWGLLGKVEAVYSGALRPTPDTPYD